MLLLEDRREEDAAIPHLKESDSRGEGEWGEALAVDSRGPAWHMLYFHTNNAVDSSWGLITVELERLRGDSHRAWLWESATKFWDWLRDKDRVSN